MEKNYSDNPINGDEPYDPHPTGSHPHRTYNAPNPVTGAKVANHAFTNIGEFGYGILTSDPSQPTLNFYLGSSADAPVLDFFGYNPVSSSYPRAGIVNLNTKNEPVLAAIIKGTLSQDGTTNYVSSTAASNAAHSIRHCNHRTAGVDAS